MTDSPPIRSMTPSARRSSVGGDAVRVGTDHLELERRAPGVQHQHVHVALPRSSGVAAVATEPLLRRLEGTAVRAGVTGGACAPRRDRAVAGGGGGGQWESNPPTRVLATRAAFEERGRHQTTRASPRRRTDKIAVTMRPVNVRTGRPLWDWHGRVKLTGTASAEESPHAHETRFPAPAEPGGPEIGTSSDTTIGARRLIGLVSGPLVLAFMLLQPAPASMGTEAWRTAAAGCFMAIWWMTEAVPIPVTALAPLVLFPLLGVTSPPRRRRRMPTR
jgi:hypothetical protein